MKIAVTISVLVALSAAAPNATPLNFLNLYKQPLTPPAHKPGSRIIGGQQAEPHTIPYQAFLEIYNNTYGWYCGGSLISENYLMTAAHCGVAAIQAYIILGAHRPLQLESTQTIVVATDIYIHEDFNAEEISNDIAVIKLPTAITLNDAIQPVKLPKYSDAGNEFVGQTARASGWGMTHGTDSTISEVLNYVFVEVITNDKCEDVFGDLESSIVCTSGDENTGTCNGDSGGPLVIQDVQIGVVSFGVVNCPVGFPSAFSRVTEFLPWLEEHTDLVIEA